MSVNKDALFIPHNAGAGAPIEVSFRLSKSISAIQLHSNRMGSEAKLGPVLQLPAGTRLFLCGTGFNERTVKVRLHDQFYFVFAEDVEPAALSKQVHARPLSA